LRSIADSAARHPPKLPTAPKLRTMTAAGRRRLALSMDYHLPVIGPHNAHCSLVVLPTQVPTSVGGIATRRPSGLIAVANLTATTSHVFAQRYIPEVL
jgi:hypothetical protein